MRIAQLVSNYHTVPPKKAGAIYQVVDRIVNGLIDRGHDISLFASGDSVTEAKLHAVTEVGTSQMGISDVMVRHYMHLLASTCYERADEFDIIHSHFNLISAFYSGLVRTPTVQTIHSMILDDTYPFLYALKDRNYISFSHSQRKQMPDINWIGNVYHGLDMNEFLYNAVPDDYYLFMGRIVEEKGPHLAIRAAKGAGKRIIIAGRSDRDDRYWHDEMESEIDGDQVQYIGEADNVSKIEYFRKAKALLFPIKWEEPFGLVMIEAMACGTPVIAFDRGSAAEIVRDGETGFIVKDVEGIKEAMGKIDTISREACRDRAERFFSLDKMLVGYERIYERVIESNK